MGEHGVLHAAVVDGRVAQGLLQPQELKGNGEPTAGGVAPEPAPAQHQQPVEDQVGPDVLGACLKGLIQHLWEVPDDGEHVKVCVHHREVDGAQHSHAVPQPRGGLGRPMLPPRRVQDVTLLRVDYVEGRSVEEGGHGEAVEGVDFGPPRRVGGLAVVPEVPEERGPE